MSAAETLLPVVIDIAQRAQAELYSAIAQMASTDDQIIKDHISRAYTLLTAAVDVAERKQ